MQAALEHLGKNLLRRTTTHHLRALRAGPDSGLEGQSADCSTYVDHTVEAAVHEVLVQQRVLQRARDLRKSFQKERPNRHAGLRCDAAPTPGPVLAADEAEVHALLAARPVAPVACLSATRLLRCVYAAVLAADEAQVRDEDRTELADDLLVRHLARRTLT